MGLVYEKVLAGHIPGSTSSKYLGSRKPSTVEYLVGTDWFVSA